MGRFAAGYEPPDAVYSPPRPNSNGLGVAGFVVSLVGFILCPFVAVVGMVMSFIAMFREPRGFAIAGFVIGLLGSFILLLLVVVFGAVLLVFGAAISLGGFKGLEAAAEMIDIGEAIVEHHRATGSYPASLDTLQSLSADQTTDPWGQQYLYELSADGKSFELKSAGTDSTPGTPDDIPLDQDFIERP